MHLIDKKFKLIHMASTVFNNKHIHNYVYLYEYNVSVISFRKKWNDESETFDRIYHCQIIRMKRTV